MSRGNEVKFSNGRANIYNPEGRLIAEALEGRMFILRTLSQDTQHEVEEGCFKVDDNNRQNISDTGDTKNKDLWHKQMGHLNEKYLDQLVSRQLVQGLTFRPGELGKCEPCILGMLTQSPFTRTDQEPAKAALDLIHMDLCGPMGEISWGVQNICT